MENQTFKKKVEEVNAMLLAGEPANISIDTYSGYTGYSPQYIVDALNEVFGAEVWGFEEIENKLKDTGKKTKTGEPMIISVSRVKVWFKDVGERVAYGQGSVTKGNYGDGMKSAQTDAIKKALSYFSIGSRAYRGELENAKASMANANTWQPKQQTAQQQVQGSDPQHITDKVCDTCGENMHWKEGGISKAGKNYKGFWTCGTHVDGQWCKGKPLEGLVAPTLEHPPTPQSNDEVSIDDIPF